jgi:hypothetical protein
VWRAFFNCCAGAIDGILIWTQKPSKKGIRLTVTYFSSSWHHRNPWKINSHFFISSSQTKSGTLAM